jgi:hypothetical protein
LTFAPGQRIAHKDIITLPQRATHRNVFNDFAAGYGGHLDSLTCTKGTAHDSLSNSSSGSKGHDRRHIGSCCRLGIAGPCPRLVGGRPSRRFQRRWRFRSAGNRRRLRSRSHDAPRRRNHAHAGPFRRSPPEQEVTRNAIRSKKFR